MNQIYSIAVLLTCHNRRNKTVECLKYLYKCNQPENYILEVFLVDDGSTDGTSEEVKKKFPYVNIIQGDGNLYWNRGMIIAWKTAVNTKDYDFYLWLNDDTILLDNALNLMIQYSESTNNKRILVGATRSKFKDIVTYSGFKFPEKRLTPNGTWQDCDFFNGNIVLIPSYVYHYIGLLDKQFRHSFGDIDYGMRASKLGFIHSLSPDYLGICEHHDTEPSWRNRSVPIFKRIKDLYSPLGHSPIEAFIFEKRHCGVFLAVIRYFSIHLRAISPQLWKAQD